MRVSISHTRQKTAAWSLAAAGLAVAGLAPAHANVIAPFTTVFGTDFTTAGTGGLRGTGTGTITVAGATGPATRSYLYYHGPTNSADPAANANVTVNGAAVTGTNIGFASDNFWSFTNSQAYRANTTATITGNGVYNLTNFDKPPNVEINGAAAAVFSNNGVAATKRDVVIFNGNDSNYASTFDPAGWDFTLSGINYTSGSVSLTLFVSDGQNFGANDDGTLRVNGTSIATGGIFQGDSLPGASIGNGNLFDIKTFDITSLLSPGVNNLEVTLDAGFSDALSVIAAFVNLPAGAAPLPPPPPPPSVPEPATLGILGLGILAMGAVRRRRR